jgi:hypothetical protein
MGKKLLDVFDTIKKEGGLMMSMRLAAMTGIPSQMAGDTPDTPENLKKFTDAYKTITGKNYSN